ncbi:MAG: YjgN family protein [Nitrospira sp.]|nr:YjgN family protein [Nitrospira sp.]
MSASCATCAAPFFVVEMPDFFRDESLDAESNQHIDQDRPFPSADEWSIGPSDGRNGEVQTHTAVFHGSGGSLFGIHLVNALLTLATLGIYYFWAKVRVRRYLFSQTEFAGDRFSYHGNARELMNGAMKATLAFGVPYYTLTNIGPFLGGSVAVNVGLQGAAWLLVLCFLPLATVGARRYRLARTSWRGIRFSFQGKTWEFMKLWLSGYALTYLSLGLYYPYFSTRKQAFLITHSYFGSEPFKFLGNGARLFRPFLAVYLVAAVCAGVVDLVTYSGSQAMLEELLKDAGESTSAMASGLAAVVGLIAGVFFFRLLLVPYSVMEQRYFWEQTLIGSARFKLPITTWPYVKLKLGNLLLAVCTLGLAWPWITIRNLRFIIDHLTVTDVQDFDTVVQVYDAAPPTGEGLDGFLDTGFDLA